MKKCFSCIYFLGFMLVMHIAIFLQFSCEKDLSIFEPVEASTPGLDSLQVIPVPVFNADHGTMYILPVEADIIISPGTDELMAIGQYLADHFKPSTGYGLPVISESESPANGNIYLTTENGDPSLGEEGYELNITMQFIQLTAYKPAGLFYGVQTLRQLLPAAIEESTVQPGPWKIATRMIRDYPRFEWRGAMLDVARHFFNISDVKRYINLLAYYKINRLHLHLSDDQGWRIEIKSWPNLAAYGGSTEVGGGSGGYYTQEEYADIVSYAESRYIMIVPEIDMPGHTNAALASYAELNCNGIARKLYTGTRVGFSSLCVTKEMTYQFISDVIHELAAITPGPYIHIGGDEASTLKDADYVAFIERVQSIVNASGKMAIGWEDISQAELSSPSIAQHWVNGGLAFSAAINNHQIVMSPASRTYMDMKYNSSTNLGLSWAGYIEVDQAYQWDPVTQVQGLTEQDILGVEAPLWTETIQTLQDIEFMAFPRLPGYAEIGWSPSVKRDWEEYRVRLGTHGPRLTAMGVHFYQSPLIPWIEKE